MNSSPWLEQLVIRHEVNPLVDDRATDVAIVGGGIAGLSTAYFTLTHTDKQVILIEGDRVGHGATGHNGGQIVSYFEQQISGLVKEYGLQLTAQAQNAIHGAWDLLFDIFKTAKLQMPLEFFTGYCGCQDLEEIIVHLENNLYATHLHVLPEPMVIAQESEILKHIPKKFDGMYTTAPHSEVMKLLETKNPVYIAALSAQKGCMNSAMFCEELLMYLLQTYPERFSLFEESHVKEICLYENTAILQVRNNQITAERVVLCTNGFERFKISNLAGADIDTKFHQLVKGSVGYMMAYKEKKERESTAISYLPSRTKVASAFEAPPYFYLTRREFEPNKSLVVIGGPEALMDDTNNYQKTHPYPKEAEQMADDFLHSTFAFAPNGQIDYNYKWHGLMGYTPNGLRCVGPEPVNPVLMYNLGCNGVGLLPSLYGGHKIAEFLNGVDLPKSIFDPVRPEE